MKLLGITKVDFDVTDQLLITVCIHQILEKKWEYNEWGSTSAICRFQEGIRLPMREVFYNTLIEYGVPMN
jgi:hypothetical protein